MVLRRALTVLMLSVVAPLAAAADFTLPGLDGEQHSLSDHRGKWVVVNYWATWCPPCLDEIPELSDFHDRHKDDDAVVLGVNFEDVNAEYLEQFVEQYFISYPVLREAPGPSGALGPIPGLPTTYLVDPEGEVVARQVGRVTAEQIEQFIDRQ